MESICKLLGIILVIGVSAIHSQNLSCPTSHNQNVYSLTVPASSPLGDINLLYVQHDALRLIPLSSTALINSLNAQKDVTRVDNFRVHPCPTLADKQTACENYYRMTEDQANASGRTSFDRGHLQPVDPFKFSFSAMDNTFYCVNIAPQDPFTNQSPWRTVEGFTDQYLHTRAGYVMTGLCDSDSRYSPTLAGYRVPNCFWKLICYKDTSGVTQVVGFIGNNTLVHVDDTAGKAQRTADTTTPRNQQDILNVMSRFSFVLDAWNGAASTLLVNRNEANAPTAASCRAKLTISQAVKDEWANLAKEFVLNHEFNEDVDLELVQDIWKGD